MRPAAFCVPLILLAAPLGADDEAVELALKRFFEGRSVVVRLDMPATSEGIDVYPEREDPLDYSTVGDRIRASGVALHEGERVTVTKIKLKDDLLEFQLGGGGFRGFWDSSGSVSVPATPKSSDEIDLEREVKTETDPARRRRLKRLLDEYRREREAQDAHNRAMAEAANEMRRERDRRRALDMGSRFNVRFEMKDARRTYATPDGVMRALERYVDFLELGPPLPQRAEDLRLYPESPPPPGAGPEASKGMTRAQVEQMYGRPLREDEAREGVLTVRVASYQRGPERIEVTYVEDVVVRVTPLASR
jgi:hypothetical protein